MNVKKVIKTLVVMFSIMLLVIDTSFSLSVVNAEDAYNINVKNDFPLRGAISVDNTSNISVDQEVNLTAEPKEGYKLKEFNIYDAEGNEYQDSENLIKVDENNYTFKMPATDVTIDGIFEWVNGSFDPHEYVKINFVCDPSSGGTIQANQVNRGTTAENWYHKNGPYSSSNYDDDYRIHIVATPSSSKYEFVEWKIEGTSSSRASIVDENKADAYLNIIAYNETSHGDAEVTVTAIFKYNPDTIKYKDRYEGSEETKTLTEDEYMIFPNITGGTLTSGTYVVDRDITLNSRLIISGEVKIILVDNKTLNSPYGVTVTGSNTLYVYGQSQETGKLIAGTAANASSAAIGGGFEQDGGIMHFCSGTVEAKVDSNTSTGAAIGGGNNGNTGNITIHGGNITANASAGTYGAGIGGGDEGYGGTVTIWDGIVNATGAEFAAGIGSGDQPGDKPVMTINIKGGQVNATGGDEGAGIGGGNEGNGATVNISGGTVIASGGNDDVGEAAGIGGGDEGDGGIVTINGGYVKAVGAYRAAGIGGGADGSNTRVTITGGEVHAYGGGPANSGTRQSGGAGIGGGAFGYGGIILIRGGDVEAKGVWGGAGIGGGYERSVTTVSISGEETKVSANADKGAAAIGGGCSGDAYNISIAGGTVNAEIITPSSGVAGAAIGSGNEGYVANIAITGGTIRAITEFGNNGAAAIGAGNKGYFGNIRIEGGTITLAQGYGGGAGIGSGSGSEKKSEQAVAKITISGGTITTGSVETYSYLPTGAGIGSGSNAVSPVNIEITGGTINAYCSNSDGGTLNYSGAGIGSGYGSPIGLISISGGTILASKGKGSNKADPIGYYDDIQNSVYPNITFNYDEAQIRNEKGEGTDKRVRNTQYDSNANLSRRLALLENESDWVEIKPCDHVDARHEMISAGEEGTHRLTCDYCIDNNLELVHEFNNENKCECGYYRYALTFTDGQDGGNSKQYFIYPDVTVGHEVVQNKLIQLNNYAPTFVIPGKQFKGYKVENDSTGKTYFNTDDYVVSKDSIFIAQWDNVSGISLVLSSIDGLLTQINVGEITGSTSISDLYQFALNKGMQNIAQEYDEYVLGSECGSRPMSDVTSMSDFNNLNNKTVDDLQNNILYVAMLKKIDEVEVEIEAPVCGTTIVTIGSHPPYDQNPRPVITVKGDTYKIDEGKRWQRYPNDPYAPSSYPAGTIDVKGGNTHYACLAVDAAYGYTFVENETLVKLNDEAVIVEGTKEFEANRILFNVEIKAVHDYGDWRVVTNPTCTSKGLQQRICQVQDCSHVEDKTIDIDSDNHDYDVASYTWSDDNSQVIAEVVCKHNSDHKISESVASESSIVKQATCLEKGKTKYVATFENEIFTNQTKTIEDIEALGHSWSNWRVVKEASLTEEGLEQRTCLHDASHIEERSIPKLNNAYKNTQGNGNIWYKGSNKTSKFTFINTDNDEITYDSFIGIKIDSNLINPLNNYSYYKGSVVIELLPSYLETLSIGDHTITALFKDDMSAEASFKVLTQTPPYIPPKTGVE